MKKIIILCIVAAVAFTGCTSKQEAAIYEAQKETLKEEITNLQVELNELNQLVVQEKEEKGVAKYYLTLKISQVHYSLNLEDHLKDAMNEMTIEIPVDKELFDGVEEGEMLKEEFRTGSAIVAGSWGSWQIEVESKEVR